MRPSHTARTIAKRRRTGRDDTAQVDPNRSNTGRSGDDGGGGRETIRISPDAQRKDNEDCDELESEREAK